MSYPTDFLWGAATASYQIEGARDADGKGASVWDTFTQIPGKIQNGDTGDVACDHYHRMEEDVAFMKDMGLQAYRFSISWPRVIPEGLGQVNEKGLDFYDRLVDALLEAGIQPWPTLHHWDLPQSVQNAGGWSNRETAQWFAEYALVVAQKLGDRVKNWMTLNEPQVVAEMGHRIGAHAPGLTLPPHDLLTVIHHLLLAHGKAVAALRSVSKDLKVGPALASATACWPDSEAAEDIEAARKHAFGIRPQSVWNLAWYADVMLLGRYPELGVETYGGMLPEFDDADLKQIAQPVDFLGVNYYSGAQVRAGTNEAVEFVPAKAGFPSTHFDWPVTPEIMRWHPRFLHERYGLPIYITENGMASHDWIALDGAVHDPQRIDFTTRYLRALGQGINDGSGVQGYFHWSLMDNLEWAEGYRRRFGLIHVDFETLKRTPKDSARWYAEVIAANGANL